MSTVMARRELFDRYGLFDESLPCCEDYDLWLRVGCRQSFLLVPEPLTGKDGGRPDQLSTIHRMGMDTFRIRSLCHLLDAGVLNPEQRGSAVAELVRKCTIYGQGCIKHGRSDEGAHYLNLAARLSIITGTHFLKQNSSYGDPARFVTHLHVAEDCLDLPYTREIISPRQPAGNRGQRAGRSQD